jgi:hypothetical protein
MNSGTGLASLFTPEKKKEIEEMSAHSINDSFHRACY